MQLDHSFSPIDNGPIYKETIYGRWPVEPYNTVTTLLFLAFVIYWALKIRNNIKDHPLIAISLPIIAVGFVGGFLYHSLRNHIFWLLLDWVPIVITGYAVSVYFWRTLVRSWLIATCFSVLPLASVGLISFFVTRTNSLMSLSYLILAASVLAPLIIYIYKEPKKHLMPLLMSVVCITLAITLRTLDRNSMVEFLPMGSHFLWHTFGALTCHFLIKYIYEKQPKLK